MLAEVAAEAAEAATTRGWLAWCDIGYFRGRRGKDMSAWELLRRRWGTALPAGWAMRPGRVHIAQIQDDAAALRRVLQEIAANAVAAPDAAQRRAVETAATGTTTFGGGFVLLPAELAEGYARAFDAAVAYFFAHDIRIKDDQTVLAAMVAAMPGEFVCHVEPAAGTVVGLPGQYDEWFMFQRILCAN
jgi:hypothetical protein